MKLEEKSFELSKAAREEVLRRICVELGYCTLGDTFDQLLADPPPTISEFVDAIIAAEGLNPISANNSHKRRMRDIVIEAVESHDGRIW